MSWVSTKSRLLAPLDTYADYAKGPSSGFVSKDQPNLPWASVPFRRLPYTYRDEEIPQITSTMGNVERREYILGKDEG